jgi:PAS domain S-box-containing protein
MNRVSHPVWPALWPLLATALAYALVGSIAVLLVIPPGYAAPLYPSAGIALACTLVYGHRVLPAVALGSFAVNLLIGGLRGPLDGPVVALAAVIAAGATLQAALAALFVKRELGAPLTLSEPPDIARFFLLGAAAACTASATVATLALCVAGVVSPQDLPFHWWTWWAGDTLGTLIGAPIVLTLIGRPRDHWAHRRITVGLSLGLVTALLGTAIAQVGRWDEQRARDLFERDAASIADGLTAQLREPMYALEATRDVFIASNTVTREDMRRASERWLRRPLNLRAIGFAQRVARERVAAFEQEMRAEGLPGYRVFDRSGPGADDHAQGDTDVVAIRYVEPMDRNAAALGANPLSIAAARPAVLHSGRTGQPAASARLRLTQELGDQAGVVVYQALYAGNPKTDAQRIATLAGFVFVTLSMDDTAHSIAARAPAYLHWCLTDIDVQPVQRLAGASGCEARRDDDFAQRRTINFAGRRWQLAIGAPLADVPGVRNWNAWLFSLVGLFATALLGALLLTVTGRTRRIEVAVDERTADLQREVGERKRTESALRESEQRFRNILDHVPIGVIYTGLDGRIREANPKLRELVGYSSDELALMSALALTHPDDRAADIELNAQLVSGEIPMFRRHKRYLTKSGHTVWALAVTTVLRDAGGRPVRLVGVVEDITEHLRLEEAERAREHAEAANRAKSDFVSRMSHELRTPLNAMLGFAQLLDLDRQPPLAPHQSEWTAQIQQAGWHLLHMINDTLDLSRIESGTINLALEAVDLHGALRATRALLEQSARRHRVTVDERLDPQAGTILGDETRIKQVLTNLLSNAIKYNVEGGHVEVTSRLHDGETVEIAVTDTGLGMTREQVGQLFQPFNRLGRESSAIEGTGIGLVISRRLAELMGGTLHAHSTPGRGSIFVLRLPRAKPAHGAADPGPAGDALEPSYRQRVVHYIEDNETNAEVMRGILAQRPQIRLEVSETGLAGLAAIRQCPPSLLLLDMHLPDIDGLELLRQLKNDDGIADLPVVVVSADATSSRIEQALTLGAANYLTKPVNVAQILSVLDDLLERLDTRFG